MTPADYHAVYLAFMGGVAILIVLLAIAAIAEWVRNRRRKVAAANARRRASWAADIAHADNLDARWEG